MSNSLLLSILCAILAIIIGLVIFFAKMRKYYKVVLADGYYPTCPKYIKEKYSVWLIACNIWTAVHFTINMLCIILSLSTVFFAAKTIMENGADPNDGYIVIMFSLLNAFLLTASYFLRAEAHASSFHEASYFIENAIEDFENSRIDKDQLDDSLKKAKNFVK